MLARLGQARRQRAPFARLAGRLIHAGIERFLPAEGGIAEIGAGDGWLGERLSAGVRRRIVFTEPLAIVLDEFRRSNPGLEIVPGAAEQLPFADGELSAIVGCCVLDVVEDGSRAARELARVLRPGGVLLHWLDLSTRLNEIFSQLVRTTLVPIPNVFTDPSAAPWPEDLFLVERQELDLVIAVLDRHDHPLSQALMQYRALFSAEPFSLPVAIAEFVKLVESSDLRRALRSLFKTAVALADGDLRQRLAGLSGRPVSSARHFENRLKNWFSPEAGFEPVLSEVCRAWELELRDPGDPYPYKSSCVGEQRQLPAVPESLLCPDAKLPAEMQVLKEVGIFAFAARRC